MFCFFSLKIKYYEYIQKYINKQTNLYFMNPVRLCAWLLLICGIILFSPGLYNWFTEFSKGTAWIQIFIGLLSLVTAIVILIKKLDRK